MSKVILVANCSEDICFLEKCDYIGIDRGAFICMKNNIPLVCAIGDFDSINETQYNQLCRYTKVIRLPKEKDMVDSEYALKYANQNGYHDIEIWGVLGRRMDHFMILYKYLEKSEFKFVMKDKQNCIYKLAAGTHQLKKTSKYLSFFAFQSMRISIQGVKFPLMNRLIDKGDTYLSSNEIMNDYASLTIDKDIIVMECDDK